MKTIVLLVMIIIFGNLANYQIFFLKYIAMLKQQTNKLLLSAIHNNRLNAFNTLVPWGGFHKELRQDLSRVRTSRPNLGLAIHF